MALFQYQDLPERERMIARRLVFVFGFLLNIFLAALVAAYVFSAWKDARAVSGADRPLEITVSGEGKVFAKPDVAKIWAAVVTEKETLDAAQAEDAKKSNAVVAYLKGAGIEEKDIKTAGYQITPQYNYPKPCYGPEACLPGSDRPRIVGYQVRNSYEVAVRDAAKIGGIVSGAVGAGANEVGNISFTIDDPEKLKAEARERAVRNAETKGRELAESLGKRLGRIVSFSEGGGAVPIFMKEAFGRGGGGDVSASAPSIQLGENEIAVTVAVTYVFE